jgi:predicted MFS family arabinose efflux permease
VERLLRPQTADALGRTRTPFLSRPAAWLRKEQLSRDFWVFFVAAFFFDFGFSVYFFLFNLYLLDLRFNDRAIGLISGAVTLGSVAGTLPAGFLARKFGLRPLLIVCFLSAPILGAFRTMVNREIAHICLAFVAGVAMCLWGVCFLPALARLTTEKNRASAFGLIFSVSIGTSTLGGFICGYLPRWLNMAGITLQPEQVKRIILLASCAIAAIGLTAVLRLRLPPENTEPTDQIETREITAPKARVIHPFLLRYLPAMALWTAVMAAFTPFANVYLSRNLHISMERIGLIFSISQIVQLCVGLLTPLLFRRLGLLNGIVVTQLITATALGFLAITRDSRLAVVLFLGFSAMQWMSSPGLYNLLMTRVPDRERSSASSMTLFCNAVLASAATAGAGIMYVRFGYPHVLVGISALAALAALLFWMLFGSGSLRMPWKLDSNSSPI